MGYPVTHAYLTDGPHLIYTTDDDGTHYHCPACSFDRNLGFTANTADVIRARDAHSATPCPQRELPTGTDPDEPDEVAELRRQLLQQLHDAAEATGSQPPHTMRTMPAIDADLLPTDPSALLTPDEYRGLAEALATISRLRRTAEAGSRDIPIA